MRGRTCPKCRGAKVLEGAAFIDGVRDGKRFGSLVSGLPCEVCGGKGTVPPTRAYDPKAGDALRDDRHTRGLGLRAEAARLGIGVVELSARERGIFDDATVLAYARTLRPSKYTLLVRLIQRLQAAEIRIGDHGFLGMPERWLDDAVTRTFRCPNEHVSAMYLKSEVAGRDLCLACSEPVVRTFPEDDADGSIRPALGLWGAWFREEIATVGYSPRK